MDLTIIIIAIITLIITAIGVTYNIKSYKKKDPLTAKVIGIGDAIVGDKVAGDKVMGNKTVNEKDKS